MGQLSYEEYANYEAEHGKTFSASVGLKESPTQVVALATQTVTKTAAEELETFWETALVPKDYSDVGNADLFADKNGTNLLYSRHLEWVEWKETHWEPNADAGMMWAMGFSDSMLRDAIKARSLSAKAVADAEATYARTEDPNDKKALEDAEESHGKNKPYLDHAKRLRRTASLKNMLTLVESMLSVPLDYFDKNPFLLCTPGGTVNLTTGNVYNPDKTDYITKITSVSPSDEGSEVWDSFLESILPADVIGYLQYVFGMALYGKVFYEGLFAFIGGGHNGKSTLLSVIQSVLGTYSGGIDIDSLTTARQNKGVPLATLRGRRLVIAGELEEGRELSTSALKLMCSTDKITAERKYKDPEEFIPSHTLILHSNVLPRVNARDNGTWRRLTIIPFEKSIDPKDAIPNYGSILLEKAGGAALQWMIAGAYMFARNDFKLPDPPESIRQKTMEYRTSEDWVANFISDWCIPEQGAMEKASVMYETYKSWAATNGENIVDIRSFKRAFRSAGYAWKQTKKGNFWLNIRLAY